MRTPDSIDRRRPIAPPARLSSLTGAAARRRVKAALAAAVFLAGGALGAAALPALVSPRAAVAQADGETGRPIPRMVSLAADEVNVRTGPGIRFPVKWVFQREDMPVEVLAEYETWRKIRDWEGAEGWVHRAMLSGRATVLVIRPEVTLRRSPEETAPAVARLAEGMTARVDGCEGDWCRVEVRGYDGWLKRDGIWGLEAGS
ncbi:MAG: SH3 domain-containing protein [Marivibrio sp.]|uniref:SH3 domain-containing protein n=1 Tax=Marivibrio sp. TaxID=2039719 RepID=UPI0032EAF584